MSYVSRLNYTGMLGVQKQSNNIQNVKKENQNDNESIFNLSENQDYKKDTQQLMEDRSYFSELRQRIQNGDMDAYDELSSIQIGEFVDGEDKNAKLYNENTKMLQEMKQEKPTDNFFLNQK